MQDTSKKQLMVAGVTSASILFSFSQKLDRRTKNKVLERFKLLITYGSGSLAISLVIVFLSDFLNSQALQENTRLTSDNRNLTTEHATMTRRLTASETRRGELETENLSLTAQVTQLSADSAEMSATLARATRPLDADPASRFIQRGPRGP